MHRFKEYLRQRRVDRVVRDGRRLDQLHSARAQEGDAFLDGGTDFLDAEIRRLERRRDADLTYIRKTA